MSFLGSVGSAISNAFGSVGSALNTVTGVKDQTNLTYKQQKAMMEAQNAYNTKMWNLQNEYNSPASQIARMREAGVDINPTSYALGTGNLSNVASNVSSESGFSGSGSPAGNPISMLMGMAQGIQGIREAKARTINLGEQTGNIREQNEHARITNEILRHNLDLGRKNNTPVGVEPGVGQTISNAVRGSAPIGKAKAVWKWLTTDSTHFPWEEFR